MNYLTLATIVVLALSTSDPKELDPGLCLRPIEERIPEMDFNQAFFRLMGWEGGGTLHEHPNDPGGLTKWGISQRSHPDVDIRNLGVLEAMEITYDQYWQPVRAELLPEKLRWDVFDFAFNAGPVTSVYTLQKSVNLCRKARGRTDQLLLDGDLGPLTLGSLDDEDPAKLLRVFRAYRSKHYLTLAERGSVEFIHGWLRRAEGGTNG